MTAYMIMDIDVLDPPQYETYKREVPKLVEKHGGEYLVRGGEFEVIEGELGVRFRIAVLRLWVSSSQIRQWQRPVEITPQRGREKRVEV